MPVETSGLSLSRPGLFVRRMCLLCCLLALLKPPRRRLFYCPSEDDDKEFAWNYCLGNYELNKSPRQQPDFLAVLLMA